MAPLTRLAPAARHELLLILMSPSNVRADVIRQFPDRGDEGMVKVLVELEADELLRWRTIDSLLEATGSRE